MAIVQFYTNCGTEPTTGQTRVMWEIGTLRMYGHALPRGRGYTFTCPKEFQIHTEQQTRSGATRRTAIEAAQLLLKWAGCTTNVRELEHHDQARTWSHRVTETAHLNCDRCTWVSALAIERADKRGSKSDTHDIIDTDGLIHWATVVRTN